MVVDHAIHILLDDGLELAFHLLLHGDLAKQILPHQGVVDGVEGLRFRTVELEHVAIFDVLIDAVEVVHGEGGGSGRVEQVDAEREVGLLVADEAEHGGHDVDLLGDGVAHTRLDEFAAGVVDDDRSAESTDIALVFVVIALVGVVVGEHEDGVAEPRLLGSLFEELAERHVGVAHALVDGQLLFFIDVLILGGNLEGVVGRGGEHGGHERLAHLTHLGAVVLQERLVPDAPMPVEVLVAPETAVGGIVLATVILLEPRLVGKRHEAHRTAVGAVEERRLVAVGSEQSANARVGVHGRGREHKRLYEHGNATEHGGHSVDALAAVAERMAEDEAMGNERIEMGCVALVAPSLEMLVEGADVFASEALDNQYDHIARLPLHGVGGLVDGREDSGCLVDGGVIVGNIKDALADGAQKSERRVEHHGALGGSVDVLVGVVDGDGAYSVSQSATTTADGQGYGCQQRDERHGKVGPPLSGLLVITLVDARFCIKPAQGRDDDDGQQHEIPVVEQFDKEDAAQVVLARELAEHAGGGASEGIRKIGRVGQVDDERQAVDNDEQPFAETLVATRLLQIQGEEHQDDVEGVGVDDGRRVEGQTALEKPQQMAERESVGEVAEVDQQVGYAGNEVNQEDQQEIPDKCRHRGERRVEDAEFLSLFVSHRFLLFRWLACRAASCRNRRVARVRRGCRVRRCVLRGARKSRRRS